MIERPEEVAQRILAEGNYEMPVDVEAVARGLNIAIRMQELEDNVSGILVIKASTAVIGVNKDHHEHRRRFTIAHEIGHYLLHRDASHVFIDAAPVFFRDERSSMGTEHQEIAANAFAAELLMPEQLLRELVVRQPVDVFDDVAVRQLANSFGVSPQAVTIRLTKLKLVTA